MARTRHFFNGMMMMSVLY